MGANTGYSPYGLHRVVAPAGVLPQRADRLDPSPPPLGGEALIEVEGLNLDAASHHQIREEQGGDVAAMRRRVLAIVRERGKLHNPVTGSGEMLIGTVREVGERRTDLRPGDRIATLVSLTLTPPAIADDLAAWDGSEQIRARGHAVLLETAPFARLPEDLSDRLALSLFDVAGAPAQVARLAPGRWATLVLGAAGKSGLLSMVAARGRSGRVLGLVRDRAEAASILVADDGGTVYFFSMATSFPAAAQTAEGLGKDVTMVIGSGHAPDHAATALELVRSEPGLRRALQERFGP